MRHLSKTLAENTMTEAEVARIVHRIDRPVVLVGMMGAGKSTVGRKLAELMNVDFMDADDEIERAARMKVSEIFERFGEDYFRDGERRVIARLIEDGRGVLATGGGAFVNDETRALILAQGIAVWIDCDLETLVERTGRKDTRPLLRNGAPREILGDLLERRAQFYAEAPIRVTSDDGPHIKTAVAILGALDRWL